MSSDIVQSGRLLRNAWILALAGAAVSFCGGDPANPQDSDPLAHIPQTAIPPDLRGLADLNEVGAEGQLEALEDGELSFAEIESALLAYAQCLVDEGVQFRGTPVVNNQGRLQYEARAGTTESELLEFHAFAERCDYQHSSILKRFWAWSRAPSERERIETRHHLAICLREHDIEASDVPDDEELGRLITASADVFQSCARRALDETGASGF